MSSPKHNLPDNKTKHAGLGRYVYLTLGLFFVGLGFLGVFLPILPTTPFLLVASYFFARSSQKLFLWLRRSRLFGPLIKDWQRHKGIRLRYKIRAVVVLVSVVGITLFVADLPTWSMVSLVLLGSTGVVVMLSLPTVR